jgi:hypothetical protein
MSAATLTYTTPTADAAQINTFAFEHMMATRNYFVAMAPLDRFSVLPYLLDPFQPMPPDIVAAQNWNLNHQQSHNDALLNLPTYYGAPVEIGLSVGQILLETNFDIPDQVSWWTFQNWMEHYIADNVMYPDNSWMWPFW